MQWIYLAIAIVAEVIATSCLKPSEGFTRMWPSVAVVAGYGMAFFFLSLTLRTLPVGVAYAVWSGAGIVLVATVGWAAFGQKLDVPAVIGMAMIIGGVAILRLFSSTAH
ncbi:MAG: DMT family transporter [Gammaproteobacteria bacterium]